MLPKRSAAPPRIDDVTDAAPEAIDAIPDAADPTMLLTMPELDEPELKPELDEPEHCPQGASHSLMPTVLQVPHEQSDQLHVSPVSHIPVGPEKKRNND